MTWAGWALLGASVVVGVVAVNSGMGLLIVLLGALLGAVHISAILSRRMVAGVAVRREAPRRCRQGEPASFAYKLTSLRGAGAVLALHVSEKPGDGLDVPPSACGHLPAHGGFLIRTEAVPLHRGRVDLSGVRLATTFPFGLVSARSTFSQSATLIVWPARGTLARGLLGRGDAHSSSITPSSRAGGADEFFGLREYRPGDSTRWIHWRRSAGRPQPVVREMSRPRPRTLWVILDTLLDDSDGRNWPNRERAIRLAATIIEDALGAGYRVGAAWALTAECRVIAPSERRSQLHQLLDALAEVDDNRARPLTETAARLSPRWLHQADVVVITPAELNGGAGAESDCVARLRRESRNLSLLAGPRIDQAFQDADLDPEALGPAAGSVGDEAPSPAASERPMTKEAG